MRIQILGINYAPERTGIAPYTTALARHLSRNHEVTVITGVPHYPDWRVPSQSKLWRRDDREGNLHVIRLNHFVPKAPGVFSRGLYEASWATRAAAAGSRIPTDVVVAVVPALLGAYAAQIIARRHKAPVGIIVQDVMSAAASQSGVTGRRAVPKIATRLERTAMRRAAAVTTIHPRLAAELTSPNTTTPTVIYNWTHVTSRPDPTSSMRNELGWGPHEIIAVHSGNMGSKQNLEVIVDAARLASAEGRPVRFVLAGGGSQRARLERYARGCSNVSFVGSIQDCDYMNFLAAADVLVVNERPGMKDMSLPSKLTSYLVAGRPIVAATDGASATAEFILASGGGAVIPAGDHGQLLDTTAKIAADPSWGARLSADGLAFADNHLSEAAAMSAYDLWIADLAAGRPS